MVRRDVYDNRGNEGTKDGETSRLESRRAAIGLRPAQADAGSPGSRPYERNRIAAELCEERTSPARKAI